MAQKATKTLAARNTATLNRTHAIALGVNLLFLLFKFLFRRQRSLALYLVLNAPALLFEFWFERIGRPTVVDGELKRAGEDLEAKGLSEWMWDITYWTWGVVAIVALAGDWAWWLWSVVPLYSAFLAFTTYKTGLGGLMPGGATGAQQEQSAGGGSGTSKRQAKLEKRGGQKVTYR